MAVYLTQRSLACIPRNSAAARSMLRQERFQIGGSLYAKEQISRAAATQVRTIIRTLQLALRFQ